MKHIFFNQYYLKTQQIIVKFSENWPLLYVLLDHRLLLIQHTRQVIRVYNSLNTHPTLIIL